MASYWSVGVFELKRENVAEVSVVIPCFRCEDSIERAMLSVINQTVKPAEVILVDDASCDGTLEILHKFALEYPAWVKVIALNKNVGAASARNVGWSIATQTYIAFLDADDSWHPEKLRIQYEYMRSNPDVALCGHQCIWVRDSETLPVLPKNLQATKISAGSLLFKNAFSTPTVMLKCDISFRFQEGKRCAEDLLLWQQIAFAGLQVVRLESPLAYVYKYLYGAGGLSAQLWKMEKGELSDFIFLYQAKNIGFLLYGTAIFFSLAKFTKRLLVTKLKGIARLSLRKGGGA